MPEQCPHRTEAAQGGHAGGGGACFLAARVAAAFCGAARKV